MREGDKLLDEHIKNLPEAMKEALLETSISPHLEKIRSKHSLMIDQVGELEKQTILALLGIKTAGEITKNIEDDLGVSEEEAREIVSELNDSVFEEFRRLLEDKTSGFPTDTDAEEDEKDILSKIEEPSPVGSRIRQVRTPYNENIPESNVADIAARERNQIHNELVKNTEQKKGSPANSENESSPSLEDPALDRLTKKTISEHEEEESTHQAEDGNRDKKYPGGNDPYREPVE